MAQRVRTPEYELVHPQLQDSPNLNVELSSSSASRVDIVEELRVTQAPSDVQVTPTRTQPFDLLIPAYNESDRIESLLRGILGAKEAGGLNVGRIIVIDDHSTDNTAAVARRLDVLVTTTSQPLHGKGQALSSGIEMAEADIVVWCDADLENFDAFKLNDLVSALADPQIRLAKAGYFHGGYEGNTQRVTFLTALPLLQIYFPELAKLKSPLSGEIAVRREVFEELSLLANYCVDIGLVIDIYQRFGLDGIAEVPLGLKAHRHHSLAELSRQATEVAGAILMRAGVLDAGDLERHLGLPLGGLELGIDLKSSFRKLA